MASRKLLLALSVIAGAMSTANAFQADPTAAPAGGTDTRYCLRVEAVTGTRLERIECWTRAEWAEQSVDVNVDWAREGVRTVG